VNSDAPEGKEDPASHVVNVELGIQS
jgi:hypothetical protein